MSNILHVLNGDATLNGFEQTGLDGDMMIWREVFSEGPVSINVSSADFWEKRSAFICNTFGETPDGYQDKVLSNLEKLNEPYEEINLWFDHDLHCQLNLLGIMLLLEQQTNLSGPAIFLVSPGAAAESESINFIGELDGEQLESLYDNSRLQLGQYDFTLATEAWGLYVSKDTAKLAQWLENTPFWGNMHQLKAAMQAYLNKLPVDESGLNYIHQKLLSIYKTGITTRQDIYSAFWKTQKIYGMGNKELDIYLEQLAAREMIQID
jgi:hypothetical protein